VKFGQGAAPPAPPEAYMQKSLGKKSHLGKTLAARLVGCRGSAGHSELAAAATPRALRLVRGFGIGHEARRAFGTQGGGVAKGRMVGFPSC